LLIFNRPDTTSKVLAKIAQARPSKLLVVADGPRADRPGEDAQCQATRALIERVDWDCDVLTHYAETNLGCRQRVSSGLDWAFSLVEQAIILEDDCVPHSTFFRFCDELLSRYRDDERVMMISGDNFQFGRRRTDFSYFFSRYTCAWGWASWRRAWQHYDINMTNWPMIRDGGWLEDVLGDKRAAARWTKAFDIAYNGRINTWDHQWLFTCWVQTGLVVQPNVNLVSNIGFTSAATHTVSSSPVAHLPTYAIDFPLQHPPYVICDTLADQLTEQKLSNVTLSERLSRLTSKVRRYLPTKVKASSTT